MWAKTTVLCDQRSMYTFSVQVRRSRTRDSSEFGSRCIRSNVKHCKLTVWPMLRKSHSLFADRIHSSWIWIAKSSNIWDNYYTAYPYSRHLGGSMKDEQQKTCILYDYYTQIYNLRIQQHLCLDAPISYIEQRTATANTTRWVFGCWYVDVYACGC